MTTAHGTLGLLTGAELRCLVNDELSFPDVVKRMGGLVLRGVSAIRFSASLFMAALVLTACGRAGPTAVPPDVDISGTYALLSINGEPLPLVFIAETVFNGGMTLIGGELALARDGTCSSTLFLILTGGGLPFNDTEGDTCTYTVTGTTFGLRWSNGTTETGALSADGAEILLVEPVFSLLYRKQS